MGKIFYIMGKSASGKDTIYENLLARPDLGLEPLIMHTTRPIRASETDGVQYHFVTEEELGRMQEAGQVIELRAYHTVQGVWYYFTAARAAEDLDGRWYLALGTLESFQKIKHYYGEETVIPIYIEVGDAQRLERAIRREKKQQNPNFEEVCRRFLADQQDFSEEKIREAGITRRFLNNEDREVCMEEAAEFIRSFVEGRS